MSLSDRFDELDPPPWAPPFDPKNDLPDLTCCITRGPPNESRVLCTCAACTCARVREEQDRR